MPYQDPEAERESLEHAIEFLTSNREGILSFDDHHIPVRFVSDPESGRLVADLPVAAFLASEHVLSVPDEGDDALEMIVTPEETPESVLTDRWMAWFGEPQHVRWGIMWIESGRFGPWVYDGAALMRGNALCADEAGLCRELNADKGRLASICRAHAPVEMHDPVCVGVDPGGIHVRARFGVVRIRFGERAANAEEARRLLAGMEG